MGALIDHYSVPCPTCGAQKGESCSKPLFEGHTLKVAGPTHESRKRKARRSAR